MGEHDGTGADLGPKPDPQVESREPPPGGADSVSFTDGTELAEDVDGAPDPVARDLDPDANPAVEDALPEEMKEGEDTSTEATRDGEDVAPEEDSPA